MLKECLIFFCKQVNPLSEFPDFVDSFLALSAAPHRKQICIVPGFLYEFMVLPLLHL